MATITKLQRKSGTVYKARVRRQGQSGQISKNFTFHADAVKWAKQQEAGIERDDSGLTNSAQKHTLAAVITRYRTERLPELAPSSQPGYDIHLRFWEQKMGHLRLSDLRPDKIAEHRDALRAEGRKPASVNRYLASLSAVMTRCVKHWHLLETNPVQRVARPTEDNARQRFLSEDELARLFDACRQSASPDLYLAVLLAITTGARKREILELRWCDIDLTVGVILLEHTKNGDTRTLAVADQVLPMLKDRKAARSGGAVVPLRDDGLVFPSHTSQNKPVLLRSSFDKALERAGIEDFHWHDLRHSCASFLAEGGASLRQIGEVLGHRSLEVTRRYAHLTEQSAHNLMRGLGDKLLGGKL